MEMIPANIKNIIFDFGAVVYDIDADRTIEAFKALNVSKFDSFQAFMSEHTNEKLFIAIETGTISPEEFRENVRSWTKYALTDKAIDFAWNAMLIGYVKERLDLLCELKTQYRTFLLSNTNIIHWHYFTKQLQEYGFTGLHELFEKDYYSHILGMRKPDLEIFKFVLKDANLVASETLFLDDNLLNIQAARMLGIPSIQITPELDLLTVFGKV
jgi:putative hydrolase of the HAD superfamily